MLILLSKMDRTLAEYRNVSLVTCKPLAGKSTGLFACSVKFNGTEIGLPVPLSIEMGKLRLQYMVPQANGDLVFGFRKGICRYLEHTVTSKKTLVCGYERRRRIVKASDES